VCWQLRHISIPVLHVTIHTLLVMTSSRAKGNYDATSIYSPLQMYTPLYFSGPLARCLDNTVRDLSRTSVRRCQCSTVRESSRRPSRCLLHLLLLLLHYIAPQIFVREHVSIMCSCIMCLSCVYRVLVYHVSIMCLSCARVSVPWCRALCECSL